MRWIVHRGRFKWHIKDGLGNYVCQAVRRQPDARLIAAAPELLEACKTAWHDMQKHFDLSEFAPAVADGIARTISMLEDAISKTEGQ